MRDPVYMIIKQIQPETYVFDWNTKDVQVIQS